MRLEEEIQQKQFDNEYAKCWVNLLFTSSWLEKRSKDFFSTYGITPQQYNALRILRGQYPNPVSVNLVRSRMLDKMSDTSRILQRLALKNLVNKHVPNYNRTKVEITITPEGLELLSKIDRDISKLENNLKMLNKEEVYVLNQLLDKMRG